MNATLVLTLILTLPVQTPNPADENAMKQTLIDVESNVRIKEWSTDSRKVRLDSPAAWSVRKYVLHGGKQEGVDVIEVVSGALSFKVIPTRGMSIQDAHCEGVRLGWDSPVQEVVHPRHVNLEARGGLGWLDGFGEMMVRCGLASNGAPGIDRVRSNTGSIVPVTLTLHGKIGYIPARRVEVIIEKDPEPRIIIRGIVDEAMMFGPRLRLISEISTIPGSKTITMRDEIVNLAATPQEMQIIYHCNYGAPLLGKDAEFVAPVRRVFPRDARAAEGGMVGWNNYDSPTTGYVEQVFYMTLFGDAQGKTEVMLRNASASQGVSIGFSTKELPCMTMWKNTAATENGYVTGLEPGTNYPNLRSVERGKGRVQKLAGGESFRATVSISALTDRDEVKAAALRIARLRGNQQAIVDKSPEE